MGAVGGLKNSESTLRELSLPVLAVCDAPSCASPASSARVLVLAQRQAAVHQIVSWPSK